MVRCCPSPKSQILKTVKTTTTIVMVKMGLLVICLPVLIFLDFRVPDKPIDKRSGIATGKIIAIYLPAIKSELIFPTAA